MQIVPSSDVESDSENEVKKEAKESEKEADSIENFEVIETDDKSLLLDNQWIYT